MSRAYFDSSASDFLEADPHHVLGQLVAKHGHTLEAPQKLAWQAQIEHLQTALRPWPEGYLLLEYAIPRMGKRADAVLLLGGVIFVLEYKVGESTYTASGAEQALDYALDLKNFHAGSHDHPIVPVVVATRAQAQTVRPRWHEDSVAHPVRANLSSLGDVFSSFTSDQRPPIDAATWSAAAYRPTPTIVEAARALYTGHTVEEISRSDAGAINLSKTSSAIDQLIEEAKSNDCKIVCFVTGVPGSGKTLAGLNIATQRMRSHEEEHAVFLSGNGPLVAVLREALARDDVARARVKGEKLRKKAAEQRAHTFIQNIHHFRDDALLSEEPPIERVVVFDEAQRAWTRKKASQFMREKRDHTDFDMSEPHFLLSVLDRHKTWCVVVCLIGGGQEINTGEAGLAEWFKALGEHFSHWKAVFSDRIDGPEYGWGGDLEELIERIDVAKREPAMHLGVSVRSFRAERVSAFVAAVIEGMAERARAEISYLANYPIVLTRDLDVARAWLREQARGSERTGLVASSGALRLKPVGLHVKSKISPADWFLNGREDVRSSFALEDVATEFDIQGLELDWVGVCWDANFRFEDGEWSLHDFRGTKWTKVGDFHRRIYLANAYRVLMTRARQGMVIFVPKGEPMDGTRLPAFYDCTAEFLEKCGVAVLVTP